MQFVRNGPDIPERLLQAHEDGRVVFFCGAGISMPAGLPDFKGLVAKIYEELNVRPNNRQKAAIKAEQFDTALGLLEAGHVGGREVVRRAIAGILLRTTEEPDASVTHEAILTLGKTRKGRTKIITTNLDRRFEDVISKKSLHIERFQAPFLPVPKRKWDGLVYLHGLLPESPTAEELDQLVVSSGDFGRAYLTERWAARFASELFRNYIVCFIGYGINDSMLRYMMDAYSADRLRGEKPVEMFAFAGHATRKERECDEEWRDKNVTPILYARKNGHAQLHKTLREWAATHRDGVRAKERIVVECAAAHLTASTTQDTLVGRMLWALSDRGGLPAKRFAEMDPTPSLDWLLGPFIDERFRHSDLERFDVPPLEKADDALKFSLVDRPAPYEFASRMQLVSPVGVCAEWDKVMIQLARWLVRHLNDPRLVIWLAQRGGQLHVQLIALIENRLDELDKLEREDNEKDLQHLRANAPKAIPGPLMRTLWRLVLTGRAKSGQVGFGPNRWRSRLDHDGSVAAMRTELRKVLTPRVLLSEPMRRTVEEVAGDEPDRIRDLVEWRIVLSADHIHDYLREAAKSELWRAALPGLLADLSVLLRDCLDLMCELGGATSTSDLSYVYQPSIGVHPQNTGSRDWTALIELTRDAWLGLVAQSKERAALAAESWWHIPYPVFRRLCLFAAAQDGVIPPGRALDWLLADERWWLWSEEVQREAMRLLVALAPQLDVVGARKLEQAILAGPPRDMFRDDISADAWTQASDRCVWLRLAKYAETGVVLSDECRTKLDALAAQQPKWQPALDQSDEFPFWIGSGDEWRKFVATPRDQIGLIRWLRQSPGADHWEESDWQQRCRDDFDIAAEALRTLAKERVWPTARWREALQAWSGEDLLKQSWREMALVVAVVPEAEFKELAPSISRWLKTTATVAEGHEPQFFTLVKRVLALDAQGGNADHGPLMRALNHPVGHVTQALLSWWERRGLEDGQGLPDEIKNIFTELCSESTERLRYGRVLLASHAVTLFRVDQHWTTQYLLPLFDWKASTTEAHGAWSGFLWSPRPYRPLMEVLKSAFLSTAGNYATLGEFGRNYTAVLTLAALDRGDTFTFKELEQAIRALPQEGLDGVARALVRSLESAGDRRAEYWANRVKPCLHEIWPKDSGHRSIPIAESFGRLCIAADDKFPDALDCLHGWLQAVPYPDNLIRHLKEAGHCKKFPDQALCLLDAVVNKADQWTCGELRVCLNEIIEAKPRLVQDPRYEALDEYLRGLGQ